MNFQQQWPHTKPQKIDFPKFDGVELRGWVLRATRYFEFNAMDDMCQSKHASTYFVGKASSWYQWYHTGKEWIPWLHFTTDVIHSFSSCEHQDPQVEFNKFKQIGLVEAYLEAFEELRDYIMARAAKVRR